MVKKKTSASVLYVLSTICNFGQAAGCISAILCISRFHMYPIYTGQWDDIYKNALVNFKLLCKRRLLNLKTVLILNHQ